MKCEPGSGCTTNVANATFELEVPGAVRLTLQGPNAATVQACDRFAHIDPSFKIIKLKKLREVGMDEEVLLEVDLPEVDCATCLFFSLSPNLL